MSTINDLKGKNINLLNEEGAHNRNIAGAKENADIEIDNAEDLNKIDMSQDMDTLDESIAETLRRDFIRILHKLEYVLIPRTTANQSKQLRDWDLWGPLLLCILLGMFLSFGSSSDDDTGVMFITVFFIVWIGGLIVTLNSQFLGAKVSIFQSICVLGYCVFPLDLAALLVKMFYFFPTIIKIIFALTAFVWASFSSVGFMSQLIEPKKKILASYPIFLFYLFLSWLILAK